MPTGRERDEAIRRAEERLRARRDAQAQSQGKGKPSDPDHDPFRHSGLADPRDPGGPAGRGGKPIDVNVIGNHELFDHLRRLAAAANGQGHRPGGGPAPGPHTFGANVTTDAGQLAAAQAIAREMQTQVALVQQLARAQRDHLDVMRKTYDQERDAVEELTETLRQASRDMAGVMAGAPSGVGGVPGGAPAGPQAPAGGSSGPGTRHHPAGPRATGQGGAQGHNTSHYDPSGLLGDGPIHGGRRNSQMDLMTHIANGGHPDTFDPNQYMTPGRNHPTSYGELQRNMRVRTARSINKKFGEPAKLPTLEGQYDDDGNLTHYNYDAKDGSPEEQIAPDDPRREHLASEIANGYRGVKLTSKVAGAFARGGAGAGIKAIPVLGTAVAVGEGVNEAAEWITEQRAANAQYQAIEGGGNFSTGVSERLNKFGARLSERFSGGMTGEQSDQLFDTLTSQGFTGQQREGYFQTASQNYKDLGMDPSDTAELISIAAKRSNTALVGLNESIRSVTDTAIKYGQSAQSARQQFAKNTEQLAASGMQGDALFTTAAADTNVVTSMGRSMANVSFAGMNNEMVNRIEATQAGMPYGRYMAEREDNPQLGLKAQDKLVTQLTRGSISGKVGTSLDQAIEAAGGKDKVLADPGLQRDVIKQVEKETGADFSNIARTLSKYGVEGVDPNDPTSAGVVALREKLGGGSAFEQEGEKSKAKYDQVDLSDEDRKKAQNTKGRRTGLNGVVDDLKHGVVAGIDLNPFDSYEGGTNGAGDTTDPNYVNAQEELKSGKKDQTIGQLLDPAKGLAGNENVGVKVKTKDGDKVVPMSTAISKYRDQVAKGTATIVDPDDPEKDGKSVKDITGGAESNYQGPDSTGTEASDDAVDESQWKKDHPGSTGAGGEGGGTTKVTVEPGPSLQNWFKFNTGNGGQTQTAASTGSPPTHGALPNASSGTP